MRTPLAAVLTVLALVTCEVYGQTPSLADVARAEEARRKVVKGPAKVYSNGDLKRGGDSSAPVPAAPPASAPPAPQSAAPSGQKPAPDQKDEKYWRDRITVVQQSLTRNRVLLEALQSRVNALTTDFVNRDDPGQRTTIESNRQTAMAEMERVKKEIENQSKEIALIQEEARKAGVPAGWLR